MSRVISGDIKQVTKESTVVLGRGLGRSAFYSHERKVTIQVITLTKVKGSDIEK